MMSRIGRCELLEADGGVLRNVALLADDLPAAVKAKRNLWRMLGWSAPVAAGAYIGAPRRKRNSMEESSIIRRACLLEVATNTIWSAAKQAAEKAKTSLSDAHKATTATEAFDKFAHSKRMERLSTRLKDRFWKRDTAEKAKRRAELWDTAKSGVKHGAGLGGFGIAGGLAVAGSQASQEPEY